ncbi:hypothetical protein PHLGIDRAFT_67777 [Phlebiopsis gigantea 11061_1 CR5-6]|uniref:Non-ribosomal peptide synthetase n=1 Tax=Phlebiopsis gigantea (strain 11061_1 CR5-6) TaxID=745531 RepID=A0A0C3SAN0_PHLG1|nr:hypothetical protein PHLGIDRAFT_67777 [Phlebiopsis gigantea 11061_1 CR5-6]
MASIGAPASHISPTGVVFSSSRNVPTLEAKGSATSSASASINEAEKAESWDDEKALARYLVPALEKGQKNARLKPPTPWIRFRVWYNPYRMNFSLAFALNMIAIVVSCTHRWGYAENHAAALALGNLTASVACRNEFFLRYFLADTSMQWAPLWWRIFLTGFIQHIGGIHSGCAAAGIAWFFFLVIRTFQHHVAKHTPAVVLAWGIITLVVINVVMFAAMPWIRAHHHNFFERHHRFAGWLAVVFVWIFVCINDSYNTENGKFHSNGNHLAKTQEFWYALFITVLIAVPWFTVRKVPVEITTPSPRVAVIKFQKGIQQGLLGRISRSATVEYHGFGIISEGIESNTHYIIAGVQGDWTRGLVNDPPKFLYTREMKFAGLPYLAHFFRRGIAICTGSGIGAVLSTTVQLDNWFLIWIGSDMEKSFGPVLFDMINRTMPKERYILFDTKKEGRRPDTMKMLKEIYTSFKAEVVLITSNPAGNAELMQGCKENGMHSFGPLWDS